MTQDQLARLFPEVPERTLRYRTRRLHDLGLTGRSRPYRDHGSAPNHHWPTRRADALIRGDPVPRGGKRKQPNPLFLSHAALLSELYVTLTTQAEHSGLHLRAFLREGEAREPFNGSGKERALAPDALLALSDDDGRELLAFVELDLGTMSHARLRMKADLYAAYAQTGAWRTRHTFAPALLFLTTTDVRAGKFLKALASALSDGPHSRRHRVFLAGAAGAAWVPHRLLDDSCLADLDGNSGLALLDVLYAARMPYEEAVAYRREREEAEAEKRRHLREEPEVMREHLHHYQHSLNSYFQALGQAGQQAMTLLLASSAAPLPDERGVLRAIARDLGEALPELQAGAVEPPGPSVVGEVALLIDAYRATQAKQVKALAVSHGEGPSLRRAKALLRKGELLDRSALAGLARDAEHDVNGRQEQHERRVVYLEWREQTARQLARKAGPLGRLTHPSADFYPRLDRERLKVCRRCEETVYPQGRDGSYSSPSPPSCHYCREAHGIKPYDPTPTASEESEAYQ